MKIRVLNIPEEGLEVRATASEEPWFRETLQQAFLDDYPGGDDDSIDLQLLRTYDNLLVTGDVSVDLKPECDRCLERFSNYVDIPIHVNLVKAEGKLSKNAEETKLESEDLDFAFYKGEEIDLAEIVREVMALTVPLRYLCSESCKGLCPQCGQNLNLAKCSCVSHQEDSRLAVLKNLMKPTA